MSYTAKGAQPKLPHEHIQAQRFSKTRAAQSRAVLEDYVELIGDLLGAEGEARITDVASRLGVSHPTAIKTISRLKREGLASGRPYRGVFLTDEGRKLAKRVKARHRIIVDGLIALGVPKETAEADAEGIEHHVSDKTLEAFARLVPNTRPPKTARMHRWRSENNVGSSRKLASDKRRS